MSLRTASLACLSAAVALAGEAPRLRLETAGTALPPGDAAIELAGGALATPAVIGGIVRLRADGPERILAGELRTGAPVPAPPEASFLAVPMRGTDEDDWRASRRVAGRRQDARVHLPDAAWGTPAERRAWGIRGHDADWDQVAVQYDGWLHVAADGTDLATRSDDGSRLWLDRDGDGQVGVGEWGGNGWGEGQGATTRVVHRAVPAGCYRFRLQAEEGLGGNCISLLWSDATRSGGELDGLHLVPPVAFARPAYVVVDGEAPLAVAARIAGPGGLVIDGPEVRWLPAGSCAGLLRVARGRLVLTADAAFGELAVGEGGAVDLAGHRLQVGRLDAVGRVLLGGGSLTVAGAGPSRLAHGAGPGRLVVDGGAELRCDQATGPEPEVRAGRVQLPGRALTAALAPLRPGLGADLPVALPGAGAFVLEALLTVPPDAPPDLGVLAYARDRHDRWHQQVRPGTLPPGEHRLRFIFDHDASAAPAAGDPPWNADSASAVTRAGLRLWSVAGGGTVRLAATATPGVGGVETPGSRLTALRHDGERLQTGRRWELACLPEPFPSDPYDPDAFLLSAEFTGPEGRVERIEGFHLVAAEAVDGGDRVEMRHRPRAEWRLRWRPRQPGAWTCRLRATWAGGATATTTIPLRVEGAPWDGYLRVDAQDPRFFSVGGAFHWPVGVNLHAVTDARAAEVLATRPTPQRGILAYAALLDRFAAAGCDLAEVWMAAWNLAIEWNAERPGFAGAGRYGQGQAAQLDALLDHAWAKGMRLVLATNHLGQGSDWCAPEWTLHPYHRRNGGWLDSAADLFTDARALALQDRHRRYLIARWADHPAVACWKIWTEVDLTNMRGNTVPWHDRASRRWHELDPYGHPVTTHWCGTYHNPDPAVIALPGIDLATFDAYQGGGNPLAELLHRSTLDAGRGLHRTGKPALCTEYGVNWNGGPRPQLLAETMSAPFAGLVAGHAGAPMCWWYEVLDQEGWFGGFRAIRRFLAGVDLRGGRGVALNVEGASPGEVSAAAWVKPGDLVGYAIDRAWGAAGGEAPERAGLRLALPGEAPPGPLAVTWVDADRGEPLRSDRLVHAGGRLILACPPWRRHLAFRVLRQSSPR